MKWFPGVMRGVARAAPLSLVLLLAALLLPSPVQAQGGLAISGSFYRQTLEIPQGSSVGGPSIYVVVFNNASEEFQVRMSWEAPLGVHVTLSDENFVLRPGDQRKVFVGVEVTPEATPGKYTVDVTAESYRQEAGGIRLMGAAGQSANLVVLGESASVRVQTISSGGDPVVSVVRLFRVIGGEYYEVSYSETGTLEATVSPGSFVASSYVGGNKLAEESFQMAAGEAQTIILTVDTIYFEGFSIIPNFLTDTEELAFAELVYTVNNLYQVFPEVKVMLKVTYGGSPEDEIDLATLAPLDKGRVGLRYNYQPKAGWKPGSYTFQLHLDVGGKVYTTSHEEILEVSETSAANSGSRPGLHWSVIAGIAAGAVLLITIIALLAKRRAS